MKRKLITFDWTIKRLLRSKANFGILEGFLSELLKEDITGRTEKEVQLLLDELYEALSQCYLVCLN